MTSKTATSKITASTRRAERAIVKNEELLRRAEEGRGKPGDMFEKNGVQFVIDAKGRMVRKPTKDAPVQRVDVVHLLKGVRVIDEDEALALVGPNVLRYMLDKKYLVRDLRSPSMFWITQEAATAYDLPTPRVQGVVCKFKKARELV